MSEPRVVPVTNHFTGFITQENIQAVANQIEAILSQGSFSSVHVNEKNGFRPVHRTGETFQAIRLLRPSDFFSWFEVVNNHSTWRISCESHPDTKPDFPLTAKVKLMSDGFQVESYAVDPRDRVRYHQHFSALLEQG